MNNEDRIEIAKNFISKHKQDDVYYWTPTGEGEDMKYLFIYNMLQKGGFGEVRILDNQYDEYGDITVHGTICEYVINEKMSLTDERVLFQWSDIDQAKYTATESNPTL